MGNADTLQWVAEVLSIRFDVGTYRLLEDQLESSPTVAVIGLVSRGKSTLVNQLLGTDVMPVGVRGETTANTEFATGSPRAKIRLDDGRSETIAPDIPAFTERLRRDSKPSVLQARLEHDFRLPKGLTLVDTPGFNDPAMESDDLSHLDEHWTRTGAKGAVLVVSVPPTFGKNDRRLLESAQRVFKTNLAIAVKALDSDIPVEDVEQAAEQVHSQTGITPIVLPEIDEVGSWGHGQLSVLEKRLERLARGSEESLEYARSAIRDQLELIIMAVNSADLERLEVLAETERSIANCPEDLRTAITSNLKARREQRRTAELRELERERQIRRSALNDEALQLSKTLPASLGDVSPEVCASVFLELAKLYEAGSDRAQLLLAKFMRYPFELRARAGLTRARLALAPDLFATILDVRTADLSEIQDITGLSDSIPQPLLTKVVTAYCEHCSSQALDDLARSPLPAAIRTTVVQIWRHAALLRITDATRTLDNSRIHWSQKVRMLAVLHDHSVVAEREFQSRGLAAPMPGESPDVLRVQIDQVVNPALDASVGFVSDLRAGLIAELATGQFAAPDAALGIVRQTMPWWSRANSSTDVLVQEFEVGGELDRLIAAAGVAREKAETAAYHHGLVRRALPIGILILALIGLFSVESLPVVAVLLAVALWFRMTTFAGDPPTWQQLYRDPTAEATNTKPLEALLDHLAKSPRSQNRGRIYGYSQKVFVLVIVATSVVGLTAASIGLRNTSSSAARSSAQPSAQNSNRVTTTPTTLRPPQTSIGRAPATPTTTTTELEMLVVDAADLARFIGRDLADQLGVRITSVECPTVVAPEVDDVAWCTGIIDDQTATFIVTFLDVTDLAMSATNFEAILRRDSLARAIAAEFRAAGVTATTLDCRQATDRGTTFLVVAAGSVLVCDAELSDGQWGEATVEVLNHTGSINISVSVPVTTEPPPPEPQCQLGPGAVCPGFNLAGLNLQGLNLTGADLSGADLSGANLSSADLTNANLTGATLRDADLQLTKLQSALLTQADLTDAAVFRALLVNADLRDAQLQGAWMARIEASGATFDGADLRRANLETADLTNASMRNTDLRGARLLRANLTSADLHGADLREAQSMLEAIFRSTNLQEVNLQGVRLERTILEEADLTRSTLSGLSASEVNLRGVVLDEAKLDTAILRAVNLESASLRSADLRNSQLLNVNLKFSDLSGARLDGSILEFVNLEGADLTEASLEGVQWRRSTMPDGSPSNGS